jgi:NADPH-dependent F420 reductase
VGILGGTGPAGRALAARLASAGCEVLIGSRAAERAEKAATDLAGAWPGRGLRLVGCENAEATVADLVVLATPWESAPATAASLADALAGKVVVSMANAIARVGTELEALTLARGSVAEAVQAALPRSSVVAGFHHLPARALAELDRPVEGDVLLCSDRPEALGLVAELVGRVPELRALDAGSLAAAGAIEALTAVLVRLNARYGGHAALKVTGIRAGGAAPR